MKIAYLRVSTAHQNVDRQEYAMPQDIEKTFVDYASGKDTENRPQFQAMMNFVREGDVVYFESFSRISRSLPDLLRIIEELERKKVGFVSLKENIDTTGAAGKLILSVLGAIAVYEREINAERREYAFRKACDEGTVGRPGAQLTDAYKKAYAMWQRKEITAVEAARRAGVSRTTFYKLSKTL